MLADFNVLRIPGPTPIPPSVQMAMNEYMIGHRSEEFSKLLEEIRPRLKQLFGTKQDVLILSGSGTSALEAAVVNTLSEGDEVLVIVTGSFGLRFLEICKAYHLSVHQIECEWGKAVNPVEVQHFMKRNPQIKAVLATYCETSTAVLNPIRELARVIKESSEALFIVDGVSCIGAVGAQMDQWNIDILLTGSQKAMMLPTGLAFMAISDNAWDIIMKNKQPRYYLDLRKYKQSLERISTPFTPAISLIFGLKKVLELIEAEGFAQVIKRHELMRNMLRAACHALELPLLTCDQIAAPTVTAIQPEHVDPDTLRRLLKKDYQLVLAGGQHKLKGRIIRIGHMGYCTPLDVLQTIAALEMGLYKLSFSIKLGSGIAAAQEVYVHDQ